MANEEKIINGIDVSNCIFFKTGDCTNYPCWCYQNPDCDYKLLQKQIAENKILQEKLDIALKNNLDKTKLKLEISDLKAENKALKNIIITIKQVITDGTEEEQCQQ